MINLAYYYKKNPWITISFICVIGLLCYGLSGFTSKKNKNPLNEMVLDSTVLSIETIGKNLEVPWDICYGPDGYIWFTEQKGTVNRINPITQQRQVLLSITDLFYKRSSGLSSLVVSKDYKTDSIYVYIVQTYRVYKSIFSKVVRYTFKKESLVNPFIIISNIPGADGHNGSRITMAPDGKLMITTGDANNNKNAQKLESLSGKILRVNPDGSIPEDNPIKNSPIWSYGHRNPQGLCYANSGTLYSSEHGLSSDDEINIIEKGRNYGWPIVEGIADVANEKEPFEKLNIKAPIKFWTPVVAPSGIAYYSSKTIPEWNNSILQGTLKECDFRALKLSKKGDKVIGERIWGDNQFGRVRDICVAPNGDVYLATSNRDWNPTCEGFPKPEDDRIIRFRKIRTISKKQQIKLNEKRSKQVVIVNNGKHLYELHCASCHKKDGLGLPLIFPPLAGSEWVKSDSAMVSVIIKGLSDSIKVKGVAYKGEMPAFKFLTDYEVADIITYVRQSFSNKEQSIFKTRVELLRNKINVQR